MKEKLKNFLKKFVTVYWPKAKEATVAFARKYYPKVKTGVKKLRGMITPKVATVILCIGAGLLIFLWIFNANKCWHENHELIERVKPTCTEDGYTGDVYCYDCEKVLKQGEVWEKYGHFETYLDCEVAATCTQKGFTGDVKCSLCYSEVEAGTEIPMQPHTPGEPESYTAPTCILPGTQGKVSCTVCGGIISEREEIPATGHKVTRELCTDEVACENCGELQPGELHKWDGPTTTAAKKCTVCEIEQGNPLVLPFHALEKNVIAGHQIDLWSLFTEGTLQQRTEHDVIDHYLSTEEVDAVYDDGETVLLTSATGWYLGTVQSEKSMKVTAMIELPYSIKLSGENASCSVFRTEDGFWIMGSITDVSHGRDLLYLDLTQNKYYYMNLDNYSQRASFDDRYLSLYQSDRLLVLDRVDMKAQLYVIDGVDDVPYLDENGKGVIMINSEYEFPSEREQKDFVKYSTYYYYSWENEALNKIGYSDYDTIYYADPEALLVENELNFTVIRDGVDDYVIKKKDLYTFNVTPYSVQQGHLWQYGTDVYHHNTFLIPQKQTLMGYAFGADNSEVVDYSYRVGWSGRYSDCHNVNYTGSAFDHYSVFDQYTQKVVVLTKYHRHNKIYNQDHVIWNGTIDRSLGGAYGVYDVTSGAYTQRAITY